MPSDDPWTLNHSHNLFPLATGARYFQEYIAILGCAGLRGVSDCKPSSRPWRYVSIFHTHFPRHDSYNRAWSERNGNMLADGNMCGSIFDATHL